MEDNHTYAGYRKLVGTILQEGAENVLPLANRDLIVIDTLINLLGARNAHILQKRFGLHGERQKFREIAKRFGRSPERIRQLEAQALSKLRHPSQIVTFLNFSRAGLERLNQINKTPLLETDVEYFEPSARILNCLNAAGVRTLGELVTKTEVEMLKIKNFGRKSLVKLKRLLCGFDLDFAPDEHRQH